jgi:Flp pilus assembly protein TadG
VLWLERMGNRMKRMISGEQGQSMVEFALLLPLLLLLLCGMVDIGRFCYAYLKLEQAAQETVRLGGLGRTDAEMRSFANQYVTLAGTGTLSVSVSPPDSSRRSGQYVKVTLSLPQRWMTPIIGGILPQPVIQAQSTIRVE